MRILIIVGSLTGGGAERTASLWANGFKERGHDVAIALNCRKSVPITYPLCSAVKIFYIWSYMGFLFSRFFNNDYYRTHKIKEVVSAFEPEVIIGVMRPWAECARRATKGQDVKIINTEHNAFERPQESPLSRADRISKFEWNKHYDYVTVLTMADKNMMTGVSNRVMVMPNPLAFAPAEQIPYKEKNILAVGRLNAWYVKGFDLLIEAWGAIAKDFPDWKLQIAGNGSSKAKGYLSALAEKYKINNQFELIGYHQQMPPIYQRSSIFVLSSRYEGFGMVLVEAMSQGCACIACDHKGRQQEIITSDEEGVICPVENVGSISSAIKYLIDNEDYRSLVQQTAIERSKYYSLENIMDRWEEIFNLLELL